MGIKKEVWARDIKEKLFPSNAFMSQAMDDSIYVDNNIVHLNNAGDLPVVDIDRDTFPAPINKLSDSEINYALKKFTTRPTHIEDIDEIEVAYNKRQSVLKRHSDQLNTTIANWMAYAWAATQGANIIRTTGDSRAVVVPGATGNRKELKIDDIFKAKGILDDMDVPEEGRVMLIPSYMYNDLLENEKATLLRMDFSGEARITSGELDMILGFKMYKRGKKNVVTYTNAATPVLRAPDAAPLATANAGVLIWHPDFVRRALGNVKVYADEDKPEYYGSIFSAMARANGRKAYADETGVVAIVEDAA